ncbi:MAG: hypothetical protein JSS35_20595 [Proteobacteria bacterium]|nr:hypothetical protein [Pseudomonadota bacterium]
MGRILLAAAGAAAMAWTASAARAATIENTIGQFDASIAFYAPVGQDFVAIDPELISIGFAYSDLNPGLDNTPITLSVYEGTGVGGALVASRTFTLPDALPSVTDSPSIIDTDFSGVRLTVGGVYTAAVSTTSFKVAVVYGADGYGGGTTTSPLSQCSTGCDLDFRVVGRGAATGAPEPAAWALMLTGFMGLGAGLRARRLAVRSA